MNVLKSIETPEDGSAIAIFYEYCLTVKSDLEDLKSEYKLKPKALRCELFAKRDLTSISLNANSFTLRFRSGYHNREQKFYLSDENQVKLLAGMIEHTLGQGLKVKKHFASLTLHQLIKQRK